MEFEGEQGEEDDEKIEKLLGKRKKIKKDDERKIKVFLVSATLT